MPGLGPEEVQEEAEGMLFHVELHGKKKKRIVSDAKATGQPDCSRCTASPPIVQVARINLHQETF